MEERKKDYREANEELHLEDAVKERIRGQVFSTSKNSRIPGGGRRKKKKLYTALTALGAAAAVLAVFLFGGNGMGGSVQVLAAAEYPEAADFEDYGARQEIYEKYGPVDEGLSRGMKQFAMESASLILGEETEKNLCYSPLSLYTALAMTAETAGGQTRQEILDCLHYEEDDLADVMYRYLRLRLTENKVSVRKVANSLWLDEEFADGGVVRQDTMDLLAEKYLVSSYGADLDSSEAEKAMADWVKKQTKGLLGGDASDFSLDSQAVMALISTVYYYDQWHDRFDASQNVEDVFTLADGTEVTAEYMCTTKNPYGVLAEDGYTASTLYMKGGSAITFVLPDPGVTPADILADEEAMARLLELKDEPEQQYAEVRFRIPKYSFQSELNLTPVVQALGVEQAFSLKMADFSGLADGKSQQDSDVVNGGSQPVWLSGIRQQVSMSIDEKGCEAAAFTRIDYAGAAMPSDQVVEFYLNRPFLIIVSCGEPLFIGVVNQP